MIWLAWDVGCSRTAESLVIEFDNRCLSGQVISETIFVVLVGFRKLTEHSQRATCKETSGFYMWRYWIPTKK